MKATLNPWIDTLSGEMNNVVFRVRRGKVIVARKPVAAPLTEGQIAQRERFMNAVDYGKLAMNDEDKRPLYEAAAKERDIPITAVMIGDYLNAPVIANVNTGAYTGQANQVIQITAKDDFGVAKVHVKISDLSGTLIESGEAVNNNNGMGPWTYTTQFSMAQPVNIEVVATDHPGGTAVTTIQMNF